MPDATVINPTGQLCRSAARWPAVVLSLGVIFAAAVTANGCAPKRVISGGAGSATPTESTRSEQETTARSSPATRPGMIIDTEPTDAPQAGLPHGDLSGLSLGLAAAALANDQIGKPYAFGGSGPERFDCSGLVQWVYRELGVPLPRISRSQASVGRKVSDREARPGDLLFFALKGSSIDHVGIYTGNGRFVHAPSSGRAVSTDSLHNSWWNRRLQTVRRVE